MSENKSQADLLRDHINLKLDQNFDYSQSSNVSADLKSFLEKNKDKKYNFKAVRPSHSRILNQCLKNRDIDPKSIGRKTKKLRFNTDLASKITPKPVEGKVDSTTAEKKPPTYYDKDGKPIAVAQAPIRYEHFDAKGVSASLNAFYLMMRVAYPELELLSEDEKNSLGNMWLPAFQRYLTENWAYIGIPLLATFGIMLPKIAEARKKNKAKKEETPETQKASREEQERKSDVKKCEWCKNQFTKWEDLKVHKRTCNKKPKQLGAV